MLKSKSFEKSFCDPLKSLLVLWQKAFDPLSKGIINCEVKIADLLDVFVKRQKL